MSLPGLTPYANRLPGLVLGGILGGRARCCLVMIMRVFDVAAPTGNQFWKARTKHGRDKLFSSDDALWEACCEYFQWVEDNPLYSAETVKFQGEATLIDVPKMRAMTISGLCLFLDITRETWGQWRKQDDFSDVITRAEEVIYSQKFAGAAADLLNANIIARDLGLADKQDHTSTDGSMTPKDSSAAVLAALARKHRDT